MKYVVVVPDGMADHPIAELEGLTPVEAANTPNMDYFAKGGVCGMATTFFEGLPYDSSIANMSILGYDPRIYFSGRSPLEAVNLGIELAEGDISLRLNLITEENGCIKDFTAGHISNEEGAKLIEALSEKFAVDGIEFYPGVSYRNILVMRHGKNPSTDFLAKQPHDIVGEKIGENMIYANSGKAYETANLLNKIMTESKHILSEHKVNSERVIAGKNPANMCWLWGAGKKPVMPKFVEKYKIEGSIVSAVDLLNGIGKVIGLKNLHVEGITGYLDTNYEGKVDAAVESLSEVDFTYIHLESTDEAGHEGNLKHKIQAIEDIDKRVLGRFIDKMDGEYRLLIMPDHPTPVEVKTHTNEAVPYAIFDSRKTGDKVDSYSEEKIRVNGSQKSMEAHLLMKKLIEGLDNP